MSRPPLQPHPHGVHSVRSAPSSLVDERRPPCGPRGRTRPARRVLADDGRPHLLRRRRDVSRRHPFAVPGHDRALPRCRPRRGRRHGAQPQRRPHHGRPDRHPAAVRPGIRRREADRLAVRRRAPRGDRPTRLPEREQPDDGDHRRAAVLPLSSSRRTAIVGRAAVARIRARHVGVGARTDRLQRARHGDGRHRSGARRGAVVGTTGRSGRGGAHRVPRRVRGAHPGRARSCSCPCS